MTTDYALYREILQRVPHVKRAEIADDGLGGYRVQVVSQSLQSPRHVVREIVSLLRTAGWHDVKSENVMVVQIQQDDEPRSNWGRLQIAGFSVSYGPMGYEADCRFTYGSEAFVGLAAAPTSVLAVARAAVEAVNQATGGDRGLHLLEATQLTISGVILWVALVSDVDGEVVAGNAVVRESTAEETVIRAVLDAINRRFVVFSGQKV
jgi:hypothetical protein